ncbi:hypothetical protein B0H11DRAFT_2219071 [Mycena galericulata]|nr:hypothetical protein B0H11DRAFT_2219071 [Mycena galericulata]
MSEWLNEIYNYVPVQHPQLLPDILPPGVSDTLVNHLHLEAGLIPPTIEDTDAELAAAGFPGARAFLEARWDWLVREHGGGRIEWAGAKPELLQNTDGVVLFPLQDSTLSIRVFPGDLHPRHGAFFFDVYDIQRRLAVNSPPSFRFSVVRPKVPLLSVEEISGIRREDIRPGEERFAVEEGTPCRLKREGKADFLFRIPEHPKPPVPDIGFTQSIPFNPSHH